MRDTMSRHVMECLGKSRVVIEDGKVVEVGEPMVKTCPLFKKHRGIDEFNEDTIRENIEYRIGKFGMCTERRETRMRDFLSFGISEILSLALKEKLIDAAVIAADGCGTVVLDDPEIVQGMGGRISGIVETEPIEKVVNDIGAERLLDPKTAKIDQFEGVGKAFEMRYNKVAVTVASPKDAQEIRDCFGRNVVIVGVHTTGVTEKEAEMLYDFCDMITACASKYIREIGKTRAVLQAGTKIPIYAATEVGAELMWAKLNELGMKPATTLDDGPEPLI